MTQFKSSNENIDNKKWLALLVLCMGTLMIVLDSTIVNVALPSIRTDLGFSQTSLAWVVNAYLLTFGGFLLLGGRLGDIYGPKKLFLIGIIFFTIASFICGMANSQLFLIIARSIQGFGGAIVSAVSLSLTMSLFKEPEERAKAMGLFGFVAAGGGSIGVLLGGILTGVLNWHWIFLVNVPIGILVTILSIILLPQSDKSKIHTHLDIFGAITITSANILAVYAIVNGNQDGWLSLTTISLLIFAILLMCIFFLIEHKITSPLVPLRLFALRNLVSANFIGILWAASLFAWFFISALYLQLVLGYKPLQVGLSFLPANIIMGAFSIGISAKLVLKYGIKAPLVVGLLLASLGLLLYTRSPVNGNYIVDVLPSMIILGFGGGIAFNPILLAAMNDVSQNESGLASGIVNTSFMMGGAIGLAVLASIASLITTSSLQHHVTSVIAINNGYHAAFLFGSLFALIGAMIGFFFINIPKFSKSI